jgi:hypothetical protein
MQGMREDRPRPSLPPLVDQIDRLRPPAAVTYRLKRRKPDGEIVTFPPEKSPAWSCDPAIEHPFFIPQGRLEIVFFDKNHTPLAAPPAAGPTAWVVEVDLGIPLAPEEAHPVSAPAPPPPMAAPTAATESQPAVVQEDDATPEVERQFRACEERERRHQNAELREDAALLVQDLPQMAKALTSMTLELTEKFTASLSRITAEAIERTRQVEAMQQALHQRQRARLALDEKEHEEHRCSRATGRVIQEIGVAILETAGQVGLAYLGRSSGKNWEPEPSLEKDAEESIPTRIPDQDPGRRRT